MGWVVVGAFTTEHTETPFGRHGRRLEKRCASHVSATFPPHNLSLQGFCIPVFRDETPRIIILELSPIEILYVVNDEEFFVVCQLLKVCAGLRILRTKFSCSFWESPSWGICYLGEGVWERGKGKCSSTLRAEGGAGTSRTGAFV